MKKIIKTKLFNNTIIITLSTIFNRGINFFILPVLTYYLTKEDYGYLGLIVATITISKVYVGLFPSSFLFARFSMYGKESISQYIFNIFNILFATSIIVFFILFGLKDIIFVSSDDKIYIISLVIIYLICSVIFDIYNTIIQLEKYALKYALFQFIWVATSIIITLILIIYFKWGWQGKIIAEIIVLFGLSIYALYFFIKNGYITYSPDLSKIKELIIFLFPMTFAVIGQFLMGTVDKIILSWYINLEAVGIYAIAVTMSIIINIVFDSVMMAWKPYFFEKITKATSSDIHFIIKIILFYKLFVILFATFFIFVIPYVFTLMIDEKFNEALQYIPILIVAYSFEGLRKPLSGFLIHINRVKLLGTITIFAATINIILNIVFIQKYGIYGAAYSTLFSFAFLYAITFFYVQKYCRLSWSFSSLESHQCNKIL